jgi:hypothetical protein
MAIAARFGYTLLFALACSSCAERVEGAATRYVDPALGARTATPVCFAAAPAALGLAERAQYDELMGGCARGAAAEGVPVNDAPGCWQASVEWTSKFTGHTEIDCSYLGPWCNASNVFRKGVRIRVSDPASGRVTVDTLAAINSGSKHFLPQTSFALCSAAFRGYPTAQKNRELTITLP